MALLRFAFRAAFGVATGFAAGAAAARTAGAGAAAAVSLLFASAGIGVAGIAWIVAGFVYRHVVVLERPLDLGDGAGSAVAGNRQNVTGGHVDLIRLHVPTALALDLDLNGQAPLLHHWQ